MGANEHLVHSGFFIKKQGFTTHARYSTFGQSRGLNKQYVKRGGVIYWGGGIDTLCVELGSLSKLSAILSDPPCKDGNVQFTSVPLKPLSHQKCERYCHFPESKSV